MEVARGHLHQQQQKQSSSSSSLVTCRETSSPPKKVCAQSHNNKTKVMSGRPAFKKVQVVYYLSRNGHLEHPHYIEVTHLANKPLRLRDFMDRLISLRGKGMPSMYSWSCKRSYKNGYVWNDLAENDVIYPSEGAEYVLKGSEIVEGCTEQLHRPQAGNNKPRVKLLFASQQHQESVENGSYYNDNPKEDDEEDERNEHKLPYATCSRGVSTDEAQQIILKNKQDRPEGVITALDIHPFLSPPASTTSSSETNEALKNHPHSNTTPKRFVDDDDDDHVGNDPLLSRSSMLFSLIACGGSTSFRKSVPAVADHEPSPPTPPRPPQVAARKSVSGSNGVNLHRGVVCKAASAANNKAVEEDEIMIKYMSENPRFGNLHCEEKEYFSGSIVESISNDQERPNCVEPGFLLQKSSSYNEERSNKEQLLLEEVVKEEVMKKEKGSSAKGRCIPRMMMCHQPNNQKN